MQVLYDFALYIIHNGPRQADLIVSLKHMRVAEHLKRWASYVEDCDQWGTKYIEIVPCIRLNSVLLSFGVFNLRSSYPSRLDSCPVFNPHLFSKICRSVRLFMHNLLVVSISIFEFAFVYLLIYSDFPVNCGGPYLFAWLSFWLGTYNLARWTQWDHSPVRVYHPYPVFSFRT